MDEAISQVVVVCDTTPERAAQYVQLADGDANQAVTLFLENGGVDLAAGHSTGSTTTRVTGAGNSQDPITIDDDGNISDDNDPQITGFRKAPDVASGQTQATSATFEDDEAMARRLQEEMYGGGDEENNVRAPISRQAETLLGPGADALPYTGSGVDPAIQSHLQAFQERRGTGFGRPGIFNQAQPTSHIWSGEGVDTAALAEATGGASEGSARNGMLARLYQPPWTLMFKGTWEAARDQGKEEKKWLLVNIQDASIFDCQVLNRDLWKNEGIAETVKENFIFLQYSKDDVRAEQYIQYYFHDHENPDAYPHVAVVDPRTGEQIKLWSRNIAKAPEFLMQLHEFLDRYSLQAGTRNPVAKRKAEIKKTFEQMTEEEQLQQALQASMTGDSTTRNQSVEDPDDLTRSVGDLRNAKVASDQQDAMSVDEDVTPIPESTIFSLIPSDQPHVEPAPSPSVTRVQIRHPAGRLVRRFEMSDTVQRIYEFLKAEPLEGKAGKEFELVSMGKNLIDSRDQTVEQAGLKNGTIMVEFVEE